MKVDIEKLKGQLENLTGKDFERAEQDERLAGNIIPMINFSTGFQIRLAAIALKTNPNELKSLPLRQYNQVASAVSNFLFTFSEP